ncbi:CPBP family intramembrane glutamic endopeptidase [Actinomadura sediminis]|uniref:CPBP family intramembrane glutamic endopeptidase n=1 Tax=Actinomadura sediminis TaxID=1038904 RepID=A0ABW3ERA0_9ACTN
MQISPDFSTLGLALSVPLLGYVLAEGLVGKRTHERMTRRRDTDPKALTRMFRVWIACAWASTAAALAVLAVSPGVVPSDLGLRLPADPSTTLGMIAGAALAVTLIAAATRFRGGAPAQPALAAMHPRTAAERGWALAMAVTAGVGEEIVYRGLLIALGVGVLGLDPKAAAALALALFVLGHAYQGLRGMLLTAVAGYSLTYLYLTTGSLALPITVHVFIDVMALVVLPSIASRRTAAAAS